MILLALAAAVAFAIAAGIGLGSVPGLNENLHLNFWFVIPVSGGIVGGLLGLGQFGVMRAFGRPVHGAAIGLLALSCAVGYASTEVGIYHSTSLDIEDENGEMHFGVPLAELVTFREYIDVTLSSSSYESSRSSMTVEYGRTGTMLTWGVDLLGSFIVALGALMMMSGKTPFCHRCDVYKRKNQKILMVFDAEKAIEVLEPIHASTAECDYPGLIAILTEAAKNEPPAKSEQAVKIHADERVCPGCNEATLLGTVEQQGNNGWQEANDLAFRLDSGSGETARLPG